MSKWNYIRMGYGITECSPVVAINPIDGAKPGTVGKVIDCLQCKIIDIGSGDEKKIGEQGMIYVKGKSIFGGYLDDKIETPFEKINGEEYYKTGDLGFLDSDGFLSITGRLKRFIKIAGEMISLPFIEGILLKKYGSDEELKIAIEALEKDGEVKIVLFSIDDIEVDEINDFMRKNGVPNLVRVSEVIKIEEIPVLGTGKTDYKILKGMISIEKTIKNKMQYDLKDINNTLKYKIIELTGNNNQKIILKSIFGKDIHIDSIDVGELMIFIRKSYNITDNINVIDIKTFGDLVKMVKLKNRL